MSPPESLAYVLPLTVQSGAWRLRGTCFAPEPCNQFFITGFPGREMQELVNAWVLAAVLAGGLAAAFQLAVGHRPRSRKRRG